MTCTSDANPPGRVFWRKYGASEERQFVETLEFNPVMRKDSGTYVCQAENAIGLSAEETVELDVLCKFLNIINYRFLTTETNLKALYIFRFFTTSSAIFSDCAHCAHWYCCYAITVDIIKVWILYR